MRFFILFLFALVVGCSSDPVDDETECTADSDCASGRCDLQTFQCEAIPPQCGDGNVDDGETCDGNCPANCNDADACTTNVRRGESSACNVTCEFEPITECIDGDGCCAPGCSEADDTDCLMIDPNCGNGTLDEGEECDSAIPAGSEGACPLSCRAQPGSCFDRVREGNRQTCDVVCRDIPTTECISSDGCCPDGCTREDDNDCSSTVFVGAACQDDDDCGTDGAAGSICLTESETSWDGGYCSTRCIDESDCPDGTVCSGTICLDSCSPDDGCRDGYECAADPFVDQSRPVCVPVDRQKAGEPCGDVSECLGTADGVQCLQGDFKDGYCMPNCVLDRDCDGDAICVEWEGQGRCLRSCSSVIDEGVCRDGYTCTSNWFQENNTDLVCTPSGGGAKDVGETCTGLFECEGDVDARCLRPENGFVDFVDNYCSQICINDFDCPFGSSCSNLPGTGRLTPDEHGVCLEDCNEFSPMCRTGYECHDADQSGAGTQCAPTGTGSREVGDACDSIADCAGGPRADCADPRDGFQDGYCRLDCATDADCPTDTSCFAYGSEPSFCIETCGGDSDCRDGYLCLDPDRDGTSNCIIAGTGTGTAGEPCEGIFDCTYGRLAVCLYDWPTGGYCTRVCNPTVASLEPCPSQTFCAIQQGLPFPFCAPDCTSDDDCRDGYVCDSIREYDPDDLTAMSRGCVREF